MTDVRRVHRAEDLVQETLAKVYATSCNAAVAKDSTVLAPHPPISIPQLVAIATSDVWFAAASD